MKRILIAIFIFLLCYINFGYAQLNATKISPANGTSWDIFGTAVVISNNYAFVGAPRWLNYAPGGAVYVFKHENGIWSEHDMLTPGDTSTLDQFGSSICVNGDYLYIGRPFIAQDYIIIGSAFYVFKKNGDSWSEQSKVTSSDSLAGETFAHSIAVDGEWIVAGDYMQDNINGQWAGAAYFFKKDGESWIEHSKVIASDGKFNDEFGSSVAISGNYAVIGAADVTDYGSWAGAAYIYAYDGESWNEIKKIAGKYAQNQFGYSVCISGDYIAIGAPYGGGTGSVYMYKLETGTWIQKQIINPANGNFLGNFGSSVYLKQDTLVVGAPGDNAVYVYRNSNDNWIFQNIFVANENIGFGESVFFSGNRIIAGAPEDDGHGEYSGAAYICDDVITVINREHSNHLINYNLVQNYPNPFNPNTTIKIELPQKADVSLEIYDITGRLVKNLVNEEKEAGIYSVIWDGTDKDMKNSPSGIYLCRLETSNGYSETKRMTLLK